MLVYTSCVNNYLPKARVLAESVKRFHPDWQFCLLLGEQLPDGVDASGEPFDRILRFDALGFANYKSWSFQHRLVEICTAVKGQALNYFLEKENQEKVIYLDPDILVLSPLSPLEEMLDKYDLLLTPHQLAPQTGTQAIQDNEICSLRHGVFNLGFVACANRGDGIAFSRYWRDRLADWCFDDKENGLFTDQKWCDLAPAYFSRLGIVRDPGYNAASWNLTDRVISKNPAGEFLANESRLRFYHFTGHDSGMGRIMSAIYGAQMPAVSELWQLYEQKLKAAGHEQFRNLAWSGNYFSNGETIPDQARYHFRHNPAIQAIFPDPFATDEGGMTGFAGYWRDHHAKESNLFYVWARKPFRLFNLTRIYLARHGGLGGAPRLIAKVRDIWRSEGTSGVMARIRKFKESMNIGMPAFSLEQLLSQRSQWASILSECFRRQRGVLIFDHMYGGGANDYREKRIAEFNGEGRPVLLATWDFFGHRLKCDFRLPHGPSIGATAKDITALNDQKALQFSHILVNELVLWSGADYQKKPYAALPYLLEKILKLKRRDSALLEIAVNDFYSVCPNYNLLESGNVYCGLPADPQRCSLCLKHSSFDVPEDFDLASWRSAWENAYVHTDEIRVFSHATAGILRKAFKSGMDHIRVEPHAPLASLPQLAIPKGQMRIGVIGHIARHKGAGIVRKLSTLLKPGESIAVIGEFEDAGKLPENVTVCGPYQRRDLPELLAREQVTVCLVPSIWPETFCYVVQECMQMNLPLVVFPLGAQAERVKDYENGIVAAEISAEAALAALRELDSRRRRNSE